MKTLQESLFDKDLTTRDLFNDKEFKKWINRPDVLWFIWQYWDLGDDEWLTDYMAEEWARYKPNVDYILDEINRACKKMASKNYWSWFAVISDFYLESDRDGFEYDDGDLFLDDYVAADFEIMNKSTSEKDGVYMTWFKGGLPKNSAIAELFSHYDFNIFKPGMLAGAKVLSNGGDYIIFMGFPKGINQSILKLFNIK